MSRRFGSNKLLSLQTPSLSEQSDDGGAGGGVSHGGSLIHHVVTQTLLIEPREVVVVLGHEAEEVRAALAGLPLTFALNPRYQEGMGTSLAAGIAACTNDTRAFLIAPGDLPLLDYRDLVVLLQAEAPAAFRAKTGFSPPSLLPGSWRARLERLDGDKGGRALFGEDLTLVDAVYGRMEDRDAPES